MCPSKFFRATACAVLLAFMPACSALSVTPLDRSTLPSAERPRCTSVAAAPMLDGMVAMLGAALAVVGIRAMAGEDTYGSHALGAMVLVGGGTIGLGFGASASSGISDTTECATAQQKWDYAHSNDASVSNAHAAYLP